MSAAARDDDEATIYTVKKIRYHGKVVPVIMQNVNGPCPLIAICNSLLLRGSIAFPRDYPVVTFQFLSNLLSDHIFETLTAADQQNVNVQFELNDVMDVMPTLQFGLDVNVKFRGITDFEYTAKHSIFDVLQIRLVHGWLVDPQDRVTFETIGQQSYNHLVEAVIRMRELEAQKAQKQKQNQASEGQQETPQNAAPVAPEGETTQEDKPNTTEGETLAPNAETAHLVAHETDNPTAQLEATQQPEEPENLSAPPEDQQNPPAPQQQQPDAPAVQPASPVMSPAEAERIVRCGLIVEEFLNATAGQLTYHGLGSLHEGLGEGELSVLFRNNHFGTITKFRGEVYTLVTDVGYQGARVVWEKLCEVDGDNVFVDSNFLVPRETPQEAWGPEPVVPQGPPRGSNPNSRGGSPIPVQPHQGGVVQPQQQQPAHNPQPLVGGQTKESMEDQDFQMALALQRQAHLELQEALEQESRKRPKQQGQGQGQTANILGQPPRQQHRGSPNSIGAVSEAQIREQEMILRQIRAQNEAQNAPPQQQGGPRRESREDYRRDPRDQPNQGPRHPNNNRHQQNRPPPISKPQKKDSTCCIM